MQDTILKRKSIRSYTGENITKEELNIILKSCDASPVGLKQYENLYLSIITNKLFLDEIEKNATLMFNNPNLKPLYNAPTLIVISSKKMSNMENVMYSNAAIMAHNIALTATSLNVGSCYIWGAISALNNNKNLLARLNLPDDFEPCCGVILGKTEEEYEKKEIPNRISKNYIE